MGFMKRMLINVAILAFIGWLGFFVIYPMINCWVVNGNWSLQSRSCNLATYTVPDIVPIKQDQATTTQVEPVVKKHKDLIEVTSDISKPFSTPLVISGKARGQWFFEASFPITIVDWNGLIIGEGHAEAIGEWMTTEYVPFTATVDFALPANTPYKRGFIILKKDNPSGLPEHDDAFELPILYK